MQNAKCKMQNGVGRSGMKSNDIPPPKKSLSLLRRGGTRSVTEGLITTKITAHFII